MKTLIILGENLTMVEEGYVDITECFHIRTPFEVVNPLLIPDGETEDFPLMWY